MFSLPHIFRYSCLALTLFFCCCNTKEKFDSKTWKESSASFTNSARQKMVDDLIASKILLGSDSTKVIQLVGQPDHREYDLFVYDIVMNFDSDIEPEHVKTLDVHFSKTLVDTTFLRSWE